MVEEGVEEMVNDGSELARTFYFRLNKFDWTRLRICENTGMPIVLIFLPKSKTFGENASTKIYLQLRRKDEDDSVTGDLI